MSDETRRLLSAPFEDLAEAVSHGMAGQQLFEEVRLVIEVRAALESARAAEAGRMAAIATESLVRETAGLRKATRMMAWATFALVILTGVRELL